MWPRRVIMLRRRDPLANAEPLIRRVYSYAAYRLGDGPDAEDATSETLLRAVRYRHTYDPSAGSEQAWMLGIARRVVAEQLAARRPGEHAGEHAAARDDDESGAVDERLALRAGLATLAQHERDLLALRYGADLAVKEIARMLDQQTNAVEVALHRTIAKLRVCLDAGAQARRAGSD